MSSTPRATASMRPSSSMQPIEIGFGGARFLGRLQVARVGGDDLRLSGAQGAGRGGKGAILRLARGEAQRVRGRAGARADLAHESVDAPGRTVAGVAHGSIRLDRFAGQ